MSPAFWKPELNTLVCVCVCLAFIISLIPLSLWYHGLVVSPTASYS